MQIPFLDLKRLNEPLEQPIAEAVSRCISSGWYILGKELQQFEEDFAKFCQINYCLGVANGLDAISLILKAYDFPQNSEILVPANTYIATIIGVLQAGYKPVLVEPNEHNYLIDENQLESAITPQTKAILLVELYGKCNNLENVRKIAAKYHLKLISDNAQSHGATFNNKPTPLWLDAAAYSFYPTKNLGALGDAGAIVSNDAALIERIKSLRNYGSSKKYVFDYVGINSRLDEVQATILTIKLAYLPKQLEKRRKIAQKYISEIKNTAITLPMADTIDEDAWHLFVVRCKEREKFVAFLRERGIGTEIHYPIPPHKQLALRNLNSMNLPISEKLHREVLSIPLNHALTDEEVSYIINTINEF